MSSVQPAGSVDGRRRGYGLWAVADGRRDLLSGEAAAAFLGITPRTLRRLLDAGDLKTTRVGRRDLLERTELDGYLQRHRVAPGSLGHLSTSSRQARTDDRSVSGSESRVPAEAEATVSRGGPSDRTAAPRIAAKGATEQIAAERAAAEASRRAFIVERYNAGIGIDRIARAVHVAPTTVYRELDAAGVARRATPQAHGQGSYGSVLTREFLVEEYVTKQRSARELALEVDCAETTVWNWLRRHGIPAHRPR